MTAPGGGGSNNIDIAVILRDELSAVALRVEQRLRALENQTNSTTQATQQNTQATQQNTQSTNQNSDALQRQIDAMQRRLDLQDRTIRNLRNQRRQQDQENRGILNSVRALARSTKAWELLGSVSMVTSEMTLDTIKQGTAAINVLAAAGAAGVHTLGQMSGILLPLPALAAGFAQGMMVAKMGFSGIAEAVKAYDPKDMSKFNEAVKEMGPHAAASALALGKIKGELTEIKKSVVDEMFFELSDTFETLGARYLPMVETAFLETASAINDVLNFTTGFFALEDTALAVGRIMDRNTVITEMFGHTINAVIRGIIPIMDAAGDVAVEMAEMMSYGANQLADRIWQNQDRIRAFAERAWDMFRRTGGVVADLGAGLYNILKNADELGLGLGKTIEKLARDFRAWTASAEGQASIIQWFRDAKPPLEALGRLVVALAKGFATISTEGGNDLVVILDNITAAVPAFVALVQNFSGNWWEGISGIATPLLQILAGLNMISPLGMILNALGEPLQLIADIFTSLPEPVQEAVGWMITFGLLMRSLNSGLLSFLLNFRMIRIAVNTLNLVLGVLRASILAVGKAMLTFLFTNPIGWIILAVIALVAAFVLLWKKCEAFRNLVKAIGQWFVDVWNNVLYPTIMKVWEWLKETWDKAYAAVAPIVARIVDWVKEKWEQVKRGVIEVVQTISQKWNEWKPVIMGVIGAVVDFFTSAWQTVSSVVSTVFGVITAVVSTGFAIWKAVFWPIIQVIWTWIRGLGEIVWSVIKLIVEIFKLGWNIIRVIVGVVILAIMVSIKVFVTVVQWVVDKIVQIWNFGWNLLSAVVNFVMGVIRAIIDFLAPYVQTIIDRVVQVWQFGWNIVSTVVGAAIAVITAIIGWVVDKAQQVIGFVVGIWQAGWNMVSGFVGDNIGRIRSVIDAIVGWMQPVLDRIKGIWDSVWGGIRDFVQGIIDKIKSGIDGISSVVRTISDGVGKVADMLPGVGNAAGGQVQTGLRSWVGELGPEAFVSNSGKISMIGQHGPEIMKFPSSGYVVPNHVLQGVYDPSVPAGVMNQLANALTPAEAFSGPGAAPTPREPREPYLGGSTAPSVQIQIERVESGVDIEAAVLRGIRAWERQQRERS